MKLKIELDLDDPFLAKDKTFNRALQALRDYVDIVEHENAFVRRWFYDEHEDEYFGKVSIE
jgi:hypothetical protein